MKLRTLTLREMQRRPARTFLTILGITLGLATVVATGLTIHAVRMAYRELFQRATGGLALEVTAPGLGAFDPAFARTLSRIEGVAEVSPRIHASTAVVGSIGSVSAPLVAIDHANSQADWPLSAGTPLGSGDEALLDESLAGSMDLAPGQLFQMWTPAGLVSLRLSGVVAGQGPAALAGGRVVISLANARHLFTIDDGRVNCLHIKLNDGADCKCVQQDLERELPAGLSVHAPSGQARLARSTLLAAEQGLTALGAIALLAAGFVIFNTFLLNLGERRQQFALLKTLGMTRGQFVRLLLGEAALIGVTGTAAGFAVGFGLATLLLKAMQTFLGVGLPDLPLAPGPLLLAGLLGPMTPILAASLPVWHASRRGSLSWLKGSLGDQELSIWRLAIAGWLALAGGLVVALALCQGWIAGPATRLLLPVTLAILLTGGTLSMPLILAGMLRLLRGVPMGLLGRLALGQLEKHRTRTGLTAGVLFLALAVAISFGQSLRGILNDLRGWYRQTITADFLVRASMPDTSFSVSTAMPDSLAEKLEKIAGVSFVDRIAFLPATGADQDMLVLARTFPSAGPLPLDLREGEPEEVRSRLLRGETVLGSGLAEQRGLHPGDSFRLATVHGPVNLTVAGTASEFAAGGSALYLEWQTARRLLDVSGPHVFLVSARPGKLIDVGVELRAFCVQERLILQSNAQLRDLIDRMLQRVTGAIWALLALVFVVASLGIINTMQMSIQEQMETFVVLRSLGLKGAQIGRLVLAQALLLGGLTVLPGALAGTALAYVICRGSASWAGVPITFRVDPEVLTGCCTIALLCAVLSAWLPARRAARMPVVDGLS